MNGYRYPLIDALRGFSILLVVVLHLQIRIPFESSSLFSLLPNEIWSFFFRSGSSGVKIFFVISGFLITRMTLKRWPLLSDLKVKDFYLFRFGRIAPPLFVLLLILTMLHFGQVEHYTIDPKQSSYLRALFAALTFHINWLEGQVGYLPSSWDILWSLSVEEVFYLFFPLICILSAKRRYFFFVLFFFVALGPFYRIHIASSGIIWSSKAYLSCMDSIALGCITALAINNKKFSPRTLSIAGFLGTILMTFILLFKLEELFKPIAQLQIDETLLSVATALVLVYCVQASPKKWIVSLLSPLIWYGKRSYEIYLTHMFVVFLGIDLFKKMGQDANRFLILFFVVLVSGLLGYVFERFYSEPLNKAIRHRGSIFIKNKQAS